MQGVGVSTFNPEQNLYPLVRGAEIALNRESKNSARYIYIHHFIFNCSSIYNTCQAAKKTKKKKKMYIYKLGL